MLLDRESSPAAYKATATEFQSAILTQLIWNHNLEGHQAMPISFCTDVSAAKTQTEMPVLPQEWKAHLPSITVDIVMQIRKPHLEIFPSFITKNDTVYHQKLFQRYC